MDIVVRGRHCEVNERFQRHVRDKIARLDRHDSKAFRVDVELCHEANPRLSDSCERIELTLLSRGPVIRAEASASDKYAALDVAVGKIEERLRRAADRRHSRAHGHGHGHSHADSVRTSLPGSPVAPASGAYAPVQAPPMEAAAETSVAAPPLVPTQEPATPVQPVDAATETAAEPDVVLAAGPLVVREKTHDSTPISLEDALHRMELVGHDFYLFCDADSGAPSVVYRRRGYTYGVLRLQPTGRA